MFEFGPYPSIPKGTRAALKIGSGGRLSADKSDWEAVVYKESGNTLILEVGGFRDLQSPCGGISNACSVCDSGSNSECRPGRAVEVQGGDGVEEGVSRRPQEDVPLPDAYLHPFQSIQQR